MQGGYGGGYGGGAPGGGAPGGGGGWGPPPGGAPPGGAPPGGGYGAPPGGAPPGGGYGAPPGGGFGGPPPGGAPPGGFGGAPPPGGGYGAPPGGGWAPPPAGGNPGGGFGPYGGGPAGPPQTGANRFFKTAAIGGAIGGVLSAIPFLNALNCCFCLLCMTGSIIGVQMYLKENPQEQLSNGDAATSGAISGVVTGLIAGVLGIFINLISGGANMAMMKSLPPDVARNLGPMMAGGVLAGIVMLFIGTIFYTAFGALGGVLGMSLFFKDRARK